MNLGTIIVICILVACIILALKSIRKNKGACSGCCSNCSKNCKMK